MGFRLLPKTATLNDVMTVILRYFTKFGNFGANNSWSAAKGN